MAVQENVRHCSIENLELGNEGIFIYFILPTSALYNNTLKINTYNG